MAEIRIPRTRPLGRNTLPDTPQLARNVPSVIPAVVGAGLAAVGGVVDAIQEDRQKRNAADLSQAASLYRQFEVERDLDLDEQLRGALDPDEAVGFGQQAAQALEARANELAGLIDDPDSRARFTAVIQERLTNSVSDITRQSRRRRDEIVEEANEDAFNEILGDEGMSPADRARQAHALGVQPDGQSFAETHAEATSRDLNDLMSRGFINAAIDVILDPNTRELYRGTGKGGEYLRLADSLRARAKAQDREVSNGVRNLSRALTGGKLGGGSAGQVDIEENNARIEEIDALLVDAPTGPPDVDRDAFVYQGQPSARPDSTMALIAERDQRVEINQRLGNVVSALIGDSSALVRSEDWDLYWNSTDVQERIAAEETTEELGLFTAHYESMNQLEFVRDSLGAFAQNAARNSDDPQRAILYARWWAQRQGELGQGGDSESSRYMNTLARVGRYAVTEDGYRDAFNQAQEEVRNTSDPQYQAYRKAASRAVDAVYQNSSASDFSSHLRRGLNSQLNSDLVVDNPAFRFLARQHAENILASGGGLGGKPEIEEAVKQGSVLAFRAMNGGEYNGRLYLNAPSAVFGAGADEHMEELFSANGLEGLDRTRIVGFELDPGLDVPIRIQPVVLEAVEVQGLDGTAFERVPLRTSSGIPLLFDVPQTEDVSTPSQSSDLNSVVGRNARRLTLGTFESAPGELVDLMGLPRNVAQGAKNALADPGQGQGALPPPSLLEKHQLWPAAGRLLLNPGSIKPPSRDIEKILSGLDPDQAQYLRKVMDLRASWQVLKTADERARQGKSTISGAEYQGRMAAFHSTYESLLTDPLIQRVLSRMTPKQRRAAERNVQLTRRGRRNLLFRMGIGNPSVLERDPLLESGPVPRSPAPPRIPEVFDPGDRADQERGQR